MLVESAPQQQPEVTVVKFVNDNSIDGGYSFGYALSDGQEREEKGEIKNAGSENEALSVTGSFKYVLDGVTYTVTYTADENGFKPTVTKSR